MISRSSDHLHFLVIPDHLHFVTRRNVIPDHLRFVTRRNVIPDHLRKWAGRVLPNEPHLALYVDAPVPERVWPPERFAEVADFAIEKLAAFILDLWRRQSVGSPSGNRLTLELTRTDIADFLGLTIETVSRNLTKLRQRRIIDLPQIHTLVILSKERPPAARLTAMMSDLIKYQPNSGIHFSSRLTMKSG